MTAECRIVLTRPLDQSKEAAFLLSQYELVPIIMPTIEVQFLPITNLEIEYLEELRKHSSWVVFTSANGVRSIRPEVSGYLTTARSAVQGEATARAFREAFLREPDHISSRFTSDIFGEELAHFAGKETYFLMPGPAVRSGKIESILREKGSKVQIWVSYETVPILPDKELLNEIERSPEQHICVFFSPSSFYSFAKATTAEILSRVHIVAFGPVTAAAIEEAGYQCRLHCKMGGMPALAQALRSYVDHLSMTPG